MVTSGSTTNGRALPHPAARRATTSGRRNLPSRTSSILSPIRALFVDAPPRPPPDRTRLAASRGAPRRHLGQAQFAFEHVLDHLADPRRAPSQIGRAHV